MADITREHALEALIVDLCDGGLRRWWDIYEETGLSEQRCKEMVKLIDEVFNRYNERSAVDKLSKVFGMDNKGNNE